LAKAITENLTVQRWLLKLDDESDGRGIAYVDISKHLSCYNWSLKEMLKFGDKWGKRWAYVNSKKIKTIQKWSVIRIILPFLQEPTYVKVLEEIPKLLENHCKPSNTAAYANWDAYLKAFLAKGEHISTLKTNAKI
jgi:hypothetical protein